MLVLNKLSSYCRWISKRALSWSKVCSPWPIWFKSIFSRLHRGCWPVRSRLLRKRMFLRSLTKLNGLNLCPKRKCLATKHDHTLFGDQTCWCSTEWPNRFKHVWTNKMFYNVWLNVWLRSNFIKRDPTRPNKVSKRENGWSTNSIGSCYFFPSVFFNLNFAPYLQSTLLIDRVWSPSIFHLDRTSYIFQSSQKRQNFILYT